MNFPSSPAIGQVVREGTISWTYNGYGWRRTINNDQLATSLLSVPNYVISNAFEAPNPANTLSLVNFI